MGGEGGGRPVAADADQAGSRWRLPAGPGREMTRQPGGPGGRRSLRPRGLRRRLVIAFVLGAAVSAGILAVASYVLVRQARLQGSLTPSEGQAREGLNLAANFPYP